MKTLTHIELLHLIRHCNPGKFELYQLDKNKQTLEWCVCSLSAVRTQAFHHMFNICCTVYVTNKNLYLS